MLQVAQRVPLGNPRSTYSWVTAEAKSGIRRVIIPMKNLFISADFKLVCFVYNISNTSSSVQNYKKNVRFTL